MNLRPLSLLLILLCPSISMAGIKHFSPFPKLQECLELSIKVKDDTSLDYRDFHETHYDANKFEISISHNDSYISQWHEIEKFKAILYNDRPMIWIFSISSLWLALVITVLYYKNRINKIQIELKQALKNADTLNAIQQSSIQADSDITISNDRHHHETIPHNDFSETNLSTIITEKEHRDSLISLLLSLYNDNLTVGLSKIIQDSEAYEKLKILVKQKQILSYGDPLWDEIENIVIKSSPKFKDNLQLLTQNRLTTIDLHTALLIKCHVSPTQMCVLLSRSKGAIVSRRETLCYKIFGEQLGTKVIDEIIRLL